MKNKDIVKNYIIGPYPSKSYKTKLIALSLCIITFILSCSLYLSFKNLFIVNDLFESSTQYTAMKNSSLENPFILSDQGNLYSIKLRAIDVEEINENKTKYQEKIYIKFLILFISFITLASIHNLYINISESKNLSNKRLLIDPQKACYIHNKRLNYKDKKTLVSKIKNRNTKIKLTSSLISKEGVK